MATVSRVGQVTHSTASGGGDWDLRLNRLLEDLQESVIPDGQQKSGGDASEYREFRMTSSTKVNDEPMRTIDEKWVEVGSKGGGFSTAQYGTDSAYGSGHPPFDQSRSLTGYLSEDKSQKMPSNFEFLAPANPTTELKSGPTSPSYTITSSTSPKVERKEYFSKSSYTQLIKGGTDPGMIEGIIPDTRSNMMIEESRSPGYPGTNRMQQSSMSSSEIRKTYTTDEKGIGQPLHSSTPIKPLAREPFPDRSVTPPPKHAEGLKTPPLVRKILQESASGNASCRAYESSKTSSTTFDSRPPVQPDISSTLSQGSHSTRYQSHVQQPEKVFPSYDDPVTPKGARYYTSTTKTEHTERREASPMNRYPPQHSAPSTEQPPKRLDELMATFGDSSYQESMRYSRDGDGGPHKSVPYGPGSHQVQSLKSVHIEDSIHPGSPETESLLTQRKVTTHENPLYDRDAQASRNVAGPPVYYPPGEMFAKSKEEAILEAEGGKGKGKMKMEKKKKQKEKMKTKHSEKGGGGAVPVPVCLPLCCACSIV